MVQMTNTQQETYSEMMINPKKFSEDELMDMIAELGAKGEENAASELASAVVEADLSGSELPDDYEF